MKYIHYLSLIVLLVVLIVPIVLFYFNFPVEYGEIDYSFNITNSSGFDLNSTSLTFGNLLPGSSVTRSVLYINNFHSPIKLIVEDSENNYLSFDNYFLVKSSGSQRIYFILDASDLDYGFYQGTVKFKVFRTY